jgi:DNA-binding transcriptional ArsR family regulator
VWRGALKRDIPAAMENALISKHLVLVCAFAGNAPGNGWFTTREAAEKMGIKERTVRHHLKRLVDVGLIERVRVFGGCRYKQREADYLDPKALAYLKRLDEVRQTFERKRGGLRMKLTSIAAMLAI